MKYSHLQSGEFNPNGINATWVSGKKTKRVHCTLHKLIQTFITFQFISETKLAYLNPEGGLNILDIITKKSTQISDNSSFVSLF